MPSHQEFTSAESVTVRISAAVRSKHVRREVKFADAIDRLYSTPRPVPRPAARSG